MTIDRTAVLACLLPIAACGDYPRDTEVTLERVRGGTVRVGLVAGPADARAAALAREAARRAGARAMVRTGAAEPLLVELEKGGLDLVVGEFDRKTPWDARVTFSKPAATRGELEVKAATRNGEHAWAMKIDRTVAAMNGGGG